MGPEKGTTSVVPSVEELPEALAAEVSAQLCSLILRSPVKNKRPRRRAAWSFRSAIYCAGVVGAAGAPGVAGVLAVTSVAGVIFTVARIFSSR